MERAVIAAHRFGLGPRPEEGLPDNPQAWLLSQLERYEPRPAALSAARYSRDAAQITAERIRLRREARAAAKERKAAEAIAMEAGMGDSMEPQTRSGEAMEVENYIKLGREEMVEAVGMRSAAALTSPTPFAERLVHFWSNHFTAAATKPPVITLVAPHEFDAIRPNIMGKFVDMLKAASLHPAMIAYLDQYQSIGPNSPIAQRARRRSNQQGRERGLNENLAREILELHTLGVHGGYTQTDVTEFARALTGFGIEGFGRGAGVPVGKFGATWLEGAHEPDDREIMGKVYRQNGPDLAYAILEDVAAHPSTAKHIATKLARHFAGDEPPASLVSKLESAFLSSGGDLPTIYKALVEAPEAWTPEPVKFRQPWEWTIAALRAAGIDEVPGRRMANDLDQLGQAPWRASSPAGYDDLADSWLGPDALVRRTEIAQRLARLVPEKDARAVGEKLFGNSLSDMTKTALARAATPQQAMVLLLVSPEMLRR